MGLGLVHFYQA